MKKVLLTLVCLGMTLFAHSQIKKGNFQVTYNEAGSGTVRTIYMSVPNDYDSTKNYPLLYAWHGSGMPGSDMRTFIQSVNAKIGAIICCPDVNGMTTSAQLNEMINKSLMEVAKYKIDPARKVITGFSMGGAYAYQIGLQNPTGFAGIIGLSPAIGSAQFTTTMWNNIKAIKMATILGTADFNWTAVNALMLEIQTKGGSLLYLPKQGVTHSDGIYFNSLGFQNDYKHCYNYVVGITDIEEDQDINSLNISAYPNPFNDKITISQNPEAIGKTSIQFIDIQGKTVYSYEQSNESLENNIEIETSFIPQGVYIIKVIQGNSINNFRMIKTE